MVSLLSGMITSGFGIAALFFLRFWRRTGDPLFAAFGWAFLLLAVNQLLIGTSDSSGEEQSWLYLPRLAAFLLIIFAIVRKNMGAPRNPET